MFRRALTKCGVDMPPESLQDAPVPNAFQTFAFLPERRSPMAPVDITADIDVQELAALNRKKATAKWVGNVTTRCLENWVRDGRFPPPIYVNRLPMWRRSDLLKWLHSRAAN